MKVERQKHSCLRCSKSVVHDRAKGFRAITPSVARLLKLENQELHQHAGTPGQICARCRREIGRIYASADDSDKLASVLVLPVPESPWSPSREGGLAVLAEDITVPETPTELIAQPQPRPHCDTTTSHITNDLAISESIPTPVPPSLEPSTVTSQPPRRFTVPPDSFYSDSTEPSDTGDNITCRVAPRSHGYCVCCRRSSGKSSGMFCKLTPRARLRAFIELDTFFWKGECTYY
jgi:hypothetical protein